MEVFHLASTENKLMVATPLAARMRPITVQPKFVAVASKAEDVRVTDGDGHGLHTDVVPSWWLILVREAQVRAYLRRTEVKAKCLRAGEQFFCRRILREAEITHAQADESQNFSFPMALINGVDELLLVFQHAAAITADTDTDLSVQSFLHRLRSHSSNLQIEDRARFPTVHKQNSLVDNNVPITPGCCGLPGDTVRQAPYARFMHTVLASEGVNLADVSKERHGYCAMKCL